MQNNFYLPNYSSYKEQQKGMLHDSTKKSHNLVRLGMAKVAVATQLKNGTMLTTRNVVATALGMDNREEQKNLKKKSYTSYSKLSEVKLLTIGIASPLRILQWAEKTLPNGKIYGEVLNANTLHHKTFKPQKGGLFCERIFGPLKDFECACGKVDKTVKQEFSNSLFKKSNINSTHFSSSGLITAGTETSGANGLTVSSEIDLPAEQKLSKATKQVRKFCPECDVEYTWSVIRRYQLGYIKLISPVTHIWFLKGTPSYLSLLLDIKKRHLQYVTYCAETLTLENSLSQNNKNVFLDSPSKIFASWQNIVSMDSASLSSGSVPVGSETLLGQLTVSNDSGNKVFGGNTMHSNSQMNLTKTTLKKRVLHEALPQKTWKKHQQKSLSNNYSTILFEHDTKQSHNFIEFSFVKEGQKETILNYTSHLQKTNFESNSTDPKFSFNDFRTNDNYQNLVNQSSLIFNDFNQSLSFPLTQTGTSYSPKGEKTTQTSEINKKQSTHKRTLIDTNQFNEIIKTWKTNPSVMHSNYIGWSGFSSGVGPGASKAHEQVEGTSGTNSAKMPAKMNVNFVESSFSLTHLLGALQLSIYYNALTTVNNRNHNLKKNNLNTFAGFKKSPKLASILHNIYINLPVELYILSSLEQKVHKEALVLSIKQTWTQLYKQAYIKAMVKTLKVTSTYELNIFKDFLKLNNSSLKHFDKSFDSTISNKLLSGLSLNETTIGHSVYETKRLHKNYSYKLNSQQIEKRIEKLQTQYGSHVLKALKNLKQPFLSYKYSTSLSNNKHLTVKYLANDITNYLTFDLNCLTDLLTTAFIKPFIFGKYLENYKTSNISLENNNAVSLVNIQDYDTNLSVTNILQIYGKLINVRNSNHGSKSFLHKHLLKTNRSDYFVLNENGLINSLTSNHKKTTIVSTKAQKNKQYNLYNTVYTLSHRERWDTEKDWYIFLLFNSAPVDYLDFPIFAYKNRLAPSHLPFGSSGLSTSVSSIGFNEDLTTSLNLRGGSHTAGEDVTEPISNAFYSGPGIVKQLLNEFDFDEIKKLDKQNRLLLYQLNKSIFKLKKQVQVFIYDKTAKLELRELCKKRDLLIRRTKLVRKLFRKDSEPSSMIITVLPVLPPDLRPIVKMGGQIAASDLNRLYQRVIYRNERLKKFLKDPATSNSYEMKYAQRLLQEAVDNLIQNGKSGMNSEKDARGRALKSLSDSLKGKQGRFRQFLLGKRVDYSGRSVIVVGPKLKLHECGLPIEMAKELYLPFLLKSILNKNYAKTVIGAKSLIKKNPALAAELLREIMQVSPVLLNRAPTLHRLGFQAFVPKLIEGRAILLHPLVCSAFNADFDGDQMAVHVPITVEARAEAWKLMLSRNNILSPATGDPLAIPSQDMVLGCYYLTTYSNKNMIKNLPGSGLFFTNLNDVMRAYEQKKVHVHALIWVKWTGFIENGSDQEEPIEIRLTVDGYWQEISSNYHRTYDSNNLLINQYMATTPGRILFNQLIQKTMTD